MSHRIHEPGVTEGDLRNVAKEHHEDAIGASTNLPPGSIELRYVPEPKQAFIDVMRRSSPRVTPRSPV
jgi:hypothetical protein